MIDVEVKNLQQLQRKLEQVIKDLNGAPMLNAMRDATLIVDRAAKINAPVDTGRLRASITPEVRLMGNELTGVVGSNVFYAPFLELGTRAHMPPVAALQTWARRHGMSAFVVARSIALRGLTPRRFLQRAFEDNQEKITARFAKALKEIVEK